MKIGWFTHHVEHLKGDGLFTGQFAGGAEMSDYEYRLQAPLGFEIEIVTPYTFDTHEIHQFDSVIVTGTDLFTDEQLYELGKHDPFVFVHHLQTPRAGLNSLIRGSRCFCGSARAIQWTVRRWRRNVRL